MNICRSFMNFSQNLAIGFKSKSPEFTSIHLISLNLMHSEENSSTINVIIYFSLLNLNFL